MAEATSPATGRRYGAARVCWAWEVPRSSFYAARRAETGGTAIAARPGRRGPKPVVSDQALLAAIRADLARSPWTGEGHRKVWARLRVRDGIRVSRKRVLRLMREHALLSPHRAASAAKRRMTATSSPWRRTSCGRPTPPRSPPSRTARCGCSASPSIGTPNSWAGTLRSPGTRFEAIQAVGMAVRQRFGHLSAGAARGLALRHDHGSDFMADDFQKQVRFWGMAPSYASSESRERME
jgi:hypothetical protein